MSRQEYTFDFPAWTRALFLPATIGLGCTCAWGQATQSNVASAASASSIITPDATASASETDENDASPSSVDTSIKEYPLTLDDIAPADSTPDDAWADYPNRWWLKTPMTFWLPQVNGHVGIKRAAFSKNVPVDVSFSDLTKSLQLAAGLSLEGGHGPWFAGFQGAWAHWKKDDITGPLGVTSIDVQANYALLNGYFGYHFLDLPLGGKGSSYPSLGVDGLLGTDWTYLDLKLNPARLHSETKSTNWFDPYVGLRGKLDLTQRIDIQSTDVIGGFDADNDKFFWNVNLQVEYRFTPKWSVFAGYQAMSQDYDSNSFVWKIITSGPIFGLCGRW